MVNADKKYLAKYSQTKGSMIRIFQDQTIEYLNSLKLNKKSPKVINLVPY